MKTAPVVPAELAFDADGVAFSATYGDRYHPRQGALAQAAQVFLHGNGLPARWQRRDRFVILETGFGLGNNFLASWAAWRGDPQRCTRLHFISVEKHPFTAADLRRAHAASPLPELAAALAEAWPPLTPNLHRLAFDGGRVELLLALGDVADWLPEIVATVDACYLDGFAPDRNPAMWQARVFKALGRLAAPGATAATWSVAGVVRAGLRSAGFEVSRAPGSGGKREITIARFAPRFTPRRTPARIGTADVDPVQSSPRHALIVGAGLAGCAAAQALAEQGWSSTLYERLGSVASAASGNPGGIFHGTLNPADGTHARFNRAAALQARLAVHEAIEHHGVSGQLRGLLRYVSAVSSAAMARQIEASGLPPSFVQALDATEACHLSNLPAASPAWFFPGGGWVQPAAFAAALLARAGGACTLRANSPVAGVRRSASGQWQVLDAAGHVLDEAGVLVLANANDCAALIEHADALPMLRIRGQTTVLPAATPGLRLPLLPVADNGYLLPALPGGLALFGATAQLGDDEPGLRADDQARNLATVARLTGNLPAPVSHALCGRVGWRCSAPDRLPLIGGVPAPSGLHDAEARWDQPRFVPRRPGLYVFTALASRGLTWAALGARVLASQISGAPSPLEAGLLDAVDAARFASRAARRG